MVTAFCLMVDGLTLLTTNHLPKEKWFSPSKLIETMYRPTTLTDLDYAALYLTE